MVTVDCAQDASIWLTGGKSGELAAAPASYAQQSHLHARCACASAAAKGGPAERPASIRAQSLPEAR
eukprot:5619365-Pyramimonas_sp.AAC.1